MNALALASAHGRQALPHVFPYLHAHIACAHPTIMGVEYIPEHTGTDPVRRLLRDFPTIKNGNLQLADQPGVMRPALGGGREVGFGVLRV